MPLDPTLPFASTDKPQLEPEFADAFQAWKASPTPATRSQLLTSVNPVINTAVKSYGSGSAGSPTLRSRARQLALRAFDSYEPQRASLKTHLLSQLRSLQRAAAQEQAIIGMPEQVGLDRYHLDQQEQHLRDQLGRDPSDGELADATGLSLKRLTYIRQARQPVSSGSILANPTNQTQDMPASKVPGADPAEAAWHDFVYYDLGPIDQTVMAHLLGMHGRPRLSTSEIARRLGVSPAAISQRAARIQSMLDERQSLGVL